MANLDNDRDTPGGRTDVLLGDRFALRVRQGNSRSGAAANIQPVGTALNQVFDDAAHLLKPQLTVLVERR